ncbi:MAG: hypothetical protein P4L87_25100 [Formivibrio sp.]|nr:hypothetical protein [Formivibrio sp.]
MENLFHYTLCGLDNVWLVNGYTIEQTPYGEAIRIEDSESLDRVIAESLLNGTAPLTGKELRFVRQFIGLSQADLGSFLGKDAQSVARWEKSGHVEPTAEKLARVLFLSHFDGDDSVRKMVAFLNMMDRAVNEKLILREESGGWIPTAEKQLQDCVCQ